MIALIGAMPAARWRCWMGAAGRAGFRARIPVEIGQIAAAYSCK